MTQVPQLYGFSYKLEYFSYLVYEEYDICPRHFSEFHHCHHDCCQKLDTKVSLGQDGFQVKMDAENFNRDEVNVRTLNDVVIVEGNSKKKDDSWGCISDEFVRKYKLPRGYDPKKVVSTMSSDGILTLDVPAPNTDTGKKKSPTIKERIKTILRNVCF